jgi:hypothetical protein
MSYFKETLSLEGGWNKEIEIDINHSKFDNYFNFVFQEKLLRRGDIPLGIRLESIPLKYFICCCKIAEQVKRNFKCVLDVSEEVHRDEEETKGADRSYMGKQILGV